MFGKRGFAALLMFAVALVPMLGSSEARTLRISHVGPALDEDYGAFDPALAYNPDLDQYLVAWVGNDDSGGLVVGENEVFIQILDANNGQALLPEDRRISSAGGVGDPRYDVEQWVDVAYNSTDGEYLVVWSADDDRNGMISGEYEIFVQIIDAETGLPRLSDDFRISSLGGFGDGNYDALDPTVAYNEVHNQYLVAWSGRETGQDALLDREIFVQRLDGRTGKELLPDDQRISSIGGVGVNRQPYEVRSPAVAYDPENDLYLVAWQIEERLSSEAGEMAIVAQRLDGETGAEIAPDDVRIGASSSGNTNFSTLDVAYNPTDKEFLVVWPGKILLRSDRSDVVREDYEIFAQAIDPVTGAEVGVDDLQVSAMGGAGDPDSRADDPVVTYVPSRDRYLVVWSGNDIRFSPTETETELFGRWLGTSRLESKPFRLTWIGPAGDPAFYPFDPALSVDSDGVPFIAWWGNDSSPSLSKYEYEIFGRFLRSRER